MQSEHSYIYGKLKMERLMNSQKKEGLEDNEVCASAKRGGSHNSFISHSVEDPVRAAPTS